MTKDKIAHVALLYHGERNEDGSVTVTAGGREIRSRRPFAWGVNGPGAALLALAILRDATGDPDAAALHHLRFATQFVSQWDDVWTISRTRSWSGWSWGRPAATGDG